MPEIISNAELFADLQITLTEIFLVQLLGDAPLADEFKVRLDANLQIHSAIEEQMRERFSREDIAGFLNNGFPRRVDLSKVIREGVS